MTRTLQQIGWLVLKDLRIESRTRQTLGLVVVLGILIVTVLGLSLQPGQITPPLQSASAQSDNSSLVSRPSTGVSATSILWVAYLFAGVLCFEKTMAYERLDGALMGLLLAPLDRGAIYLAKLCSNLVLMFAVAAIITPVGILFFNFDLSRGIAGFLAIMSLSMVGFAAVGTLFAAVVSSSRLQGGLLAMVVFPLTLPLVVASTHLMSRMYESGVSPHGSAFAVLLAFDAIFLVVSWLAFEWVLEP